MEYNRNYGCRITDDVLINGSALKLAAGQRINTSLSACIVEI